MGPVRYRGEEDERGEPAADLVVAETKSGKLTTSQFHILTNYSVLCVRTIFHLFELLFILLPYIAQSWALLCPTIHTSSTPHPSGSDHLYHQTSLIHLLHHSGTIAASTGLGIPGSEHAPSYTAARSPPAEPA